MDDCIFCKIVKGDMPSFKIYEDNDFLAVLDIAQFAQGHTIVIPKKHAEFVWIVEKKKEYFELIDRIANHFRKLGYKYVDSMSLGRMVKHAHVHLIPHNGEENDWRKSLKEVETMQKDSSRRPTKEKGVEIMQKFRLQ